MNPEQNKQGLSFQVRYQAYLDQVEAALPVFLGEQAEADGGRVVDAARYSLLAGGKRIRPVLFLAVADLLDCLDDAVLPFACAIEMIHTYSLIHDDLPAMDDDDLRRGRPTCHKVYGEAMAVLAGDHLLNRACEILLDAIDPARPKTLAAARLISRAAGSRGMIGGQVLDLMAEQRKPGAAELERLHRMKTGALLSAPVEAAAILSHAQPDTAETLARFGRTLGLAFQICDDLLDVTSSSAVLGKTAGKDYRDNKMTFITLYGLQETRRRLQETTREAEAELALLGAGDGTSFLRELTRFLLNRQS